MTESNNQAVEGCPHVRGTLIEYYKEGLVDQVREHIKQSISDRTFDTQELIELAKESKEAASLVKELAHSNGIEDTELAERIAREIIGDIEAYVDLHLKKYQKFTLNAPQLTSTIDGSKAKFFNLISLIKDVSILGRKLLETSPRFEYSKPSVPNQVASCSIRLDKKQWLSDSSDGQQQQRDTRSQMSEEDATSEDLLAALIESSSTDDFLVLSSSLDTITVRDMMVSALILITSHECFTLSHDIQGVVMVLRRAKFMIKNILAPKNQMELVTKLLTAIGRYNEMNYVFDLFRDRNQFEILLSKGVEKSPELRIALFNYVKKNPEFYALVTLNFSMFREIAESLEASALKRLEKLILNGKKKKSIKARKKVSLIIGGGGGGGGGSDCVASQQQQLHHDLQHLEIRSGATAAGNRETAGTTATTTSVLGSKLRKSNSIASIGGGLESLGPTNDSRLPAAATGSTTPSFTSATATGNISSSNNNNNKPLYSRDSLNLCLVEMVDASDCFARAGCYKRSNDCESKAKLVALQMALLGSEINVLDLQQAELNDTIVSLESFSDAYIVAQAYDYHLSWRQALFRNVVLRGQANYLNEFSLRCDLSEALVMELVLLYRQYLANNRLGHEELLRLGNSMKSILKRLKPVALKCQLFSEFNFNDAKEELIQNASVRAYLRDLKLV